MTAPHHRTDSPATAATVGGEAASLPAARTGAPQPSAPPELDYNGRKHRRAMDDATLWDMARRIPAALIQTARLAWCVDRHMALTIVVCQLLSGVGTGVMLTAVAKAMPQLMVDDPRQGLAQAWPALTVAVVAMATGASMWILADWATRRLNPQIASAADLQLVDLHMRAELAAYDAEGFGDRSQAAEIGALRAVDLADDAKTLTNGLIQLASAAVVLTTLHPLLFGVLLLSVVPRGLGGVIAARVDYRVHDQTISARNVRGMMRWWLTTAELADELRANTMRGYLHFWYRSMCDRVETREVAGARPYLRITLLAASLGGLFTLGMWASLAGLVLAGAMTTAIAGTAVVASQTAGRALNSIIRYSTVMFHHGLYLSDYYDFIDEVRAMTTARGTVLARPPQQIRLEGASYTYPSKEAAAVKPITLTLNRGEVVALVGENGAGKSTLIRMLTGLTVASDGKVLWDDIDLTDADAESVWRHVGLVPQKNGHWPLAARENITLGQPREHGDERIWDAVERVGMTKALRELPKGLETLLARSVWGGHELSGGQWQRLACARAMYREPAVLVLDEPTSEMDARGEHQIFRELRAMASDRITVVVTHRLDNVRMADRVIVLDRGTVREQGSFDELVATEGSLLGELYALAQDR
ncbi:MULTISPECIES: ABC transporter ATP-binding protein [unclassified Streptomyces]|uniref:ABC transporter ATP-binding protein n=1 Tax=unclassified Streptomyces TaxID=2593676 RepID=UPI002E30F8FA|nr:MULTISPECIES: ABC transporter ATP-binding protein [unclassified Streptomyces]WUC69189.1 ABC transporter ATP-binding protein/permease [Streptomyces sp. NBC_00539]